MRHCYSEQEGDWIDTVCRAMNRWAMGSNEVEATARLWAGESASLDAAATTSAGATVTDQPFKVDPLPPPAPRPAHSSIRARLTRVSDQPGLAAGA